MTNEEFNLENFADLFDTAMTSTNPTVKRAFKNLMLVSALVEAENTDKEVGPLRGLINKVYSLESKVLLLENLRNTTTYGTMPISSPYLPNGPTGPTGPTWITNTSGAIGPSGPTASTATYTYTPNNYLSHESFLNNLEIKSNIGSDSDEA